MYCPRFCRLSLVTAPRAIGGFVVVSLVYGFFLHTHFTTPYGLAQDVDPGRPKATNPPRVLLVSAMFPLAKAKHTQSEYESWLHQFLGHITTDIYFFTTPEFSSVARRNRPENLAFYLNTTYSSAFHIPPLRGLEETYAKIHKMDREGFRHNPDLYAVWNAKPFFLDAAVKQMALEGKTYDYAFWCDAGSFRSPHFYTDWPDGWGVDRLWAEGSEMAKVSKLDLLFFPLAFLPRVETRNWREDMGPIDSDVSEGSFFGGSPQTVEWWAKTFYAYHYHYLSMNYFVGKDQTLINALLHLFANRVITVLPRDPEVHTEFMGTCGDVWYYYEFWLSNQDTRERMRRKWQRDESLLPWNWFRTYWPCRVTRLLVLEQRLRDHYGAQWRPPSSSVRP